MAEAGLVITTPNSASCFVLDLDLVDVVQHSSALHIMALASSTVQGETTALYSKPLILFYIDISFSQISMLTRFCFSFKKPSFPLTSGNLSPMVYLSQASFQTSKLIVETRSVCFRSWFISGYAALAVTIGLLWSGCCGNVWRACCSSATSYSSWLPSSPDRYYNRTCVASRPVHVESCHNPLLAAGEVTVCVHYHRYWDSNWW